MGRLWKVVTAYLVLGFYYSLHLALVYVNYLAVKSSFLQFNYDNTPLKRDAILGWLFASLGLDNFSQADLYALILAVIMGFCTKMLFFEVYSAFRIYQDLDEYRAANNLATAKKTLVGKLVFSGLLVVPFMVMCAYEVSLFRSRFAAWVLQMDDDKISTSLPVWETILKEHGDLYGISLVSLGAFAYLSMVFLISFAVERKTEAKEEALVGLREAFVFWIDELNGAPSPEAAPIQPAFEAVPASVHIQPESASATAAGQETVQGEPAADGTGEGVAWPENEEAAPFEAHTSTQRGHDDDFVTVYGGEVGEKVRFAEAAADPATYHIDSRRRVWKRASQAGGSEDYSNEPTAAAA
jgi:hypothetical protein